MVFGYLLIDLFYFGGLIGLLALSVFVSATARGALFDAGLTSPSFVLTLSVLLGALAWIFTAALLGALVPKARPGRYQVMAHPMFFAWIASLLLRRFLDIPPLHTVVAHSNVLRFLVLRLLGARVHFTASMSSDVALLDPALFCAGKGCVVGAQSIVTGHLIVEGHLHLGLVRLGDGVEIGGRCMLGPGVTVGDRARIGAAVSLSPRVFIGEGTTIGPHAVLGTGVHVGRGARVRGSSYVPPGTKIEDGGVWPSTD